ncbi:hypothetical protein DY000_02040559 [Brassica cretica]|uniref:Transposase-associated domain-containing protein n=1 Tax=Brassica cretica TaxID=69181 RepID=A0ABQ7BBH6_BRACR|nr:hypothetical protein DY000_02040559 [Brassica cretica]
MSFYFDSREWMDQRIDHESNSVSEVFLGGIIAFLQFACSQADYEERQTLLCLCAQCKNVKQRDTKLVSRHLFLYVFRENYYVWTSHGEKFYTVGESSGANHSTGEKKMWENPTWNAHEDHYQVSPSSIPSLTVFRLPLTSLKMNSARVPGTTTVPPPMPPGATGPASNHVASSSRSNSYPFGIDPCVNSFILATWQAHYMGPWKSWRKVPDEKRESWWQTFVNAKGKRGHVYGLGSAQYREQAPSSRVPNGLAHNLELEMRVGGLETSLQSVRQDVAEVKQDVSEMKRDFASTRDAMNQLLQTPRPQQAPTEQAYAQPQAPTTKP